MSIQIQNASLGYGAGYPGLKKVPEEPFILDTLLTKDELGWQIADASSV